MAGQFNTTSPAAPFTGSHDEEDRHGRGPHAGTLLLPKWWGIHHRNKALLPQKNFKTAPRKRKACLTRNGELCLQDGKDRGPPPLHLARPGGAGEQEAAGAGRGGGGEEAPPQALLVCQPCRKLTSYEGFRSPPAGSRAEARAFLCFTAWQPLRSGVYVLGIDVWGFLLYFFFFLSFFFLFASWF